MSNLNIPQYLIVHHCGGTDANPLEDSSNQTFETVDTYHKSLWNFVSSLGHYIGYQYFIDKTGKLTQGRADTDEGAHTIGYNLKSIGICLAGNFDATLPTQAQINTLTSLLAQKSLQYSILAGKIVPHRMFAAKTCYGGKLSDTWASDLIKVASVSPTISSDAVKQAVTLIDQASTILKKEINK